MGSRPVEDAESSREVIPPLCSIITVCLNNVEGLRETAASIQAQEIASSEIEWIVIDGESTDGTVPFLRTSTARWISEPDAGLYDAMNKGISLCRGTYLWFMNAGDVLHSRHTLRQISESLRCENLPDFLYGDSAELDMNGNERRKVARPSTWIDRGMFTHHQAMLFRRALCGTLRYDLSLKIAADYAFVWAFLERAKSVVYLPTPLVVFQHGGVSERNARLGMREQSIVRQRHGASRLLIALMFGRSLAARFLKRFVPQSHLMAREASARLSRTLSSRR